MGVLFSYVTNAFASSGSAQAALVLIPSSSAVGSLIVYDICYHMTLQVEQQCTGGFI